MTSTTHCPDCDVAYAFEEQLHCPHCARLRGVKNLIDIRNPNPVRLARVALSRATDKVSDVRDYLPGNYRVLGMLIDGNVVIVGQDSAGWTLEDYVIPRLGSGLYYCEEINLEELS